MRILIVCAGNTCRSPMAAGLLKKLAESRRLTLEVRTAGLAHHPGGRVAENATKVMAEIGVDISFEYSKPVTGEALSWADLVVALQGNHAAHLIEEFPNTASKVRVLEADVPDPYRQPVSVYRATRDSLQHFLEPLVDTLDGPV